MLQIAPVRKCWKASELEKCGNLPKVRKMLQIASKLKKCWKLPQS